MPAYWIAHVTVTDPERYRRYIEAAPPVIAGFGGRFLARGGPSTTCEGRHFERQVVIEFPDIEAARACYASEAYKSARALREGACEAHVSIVEGF